MSAQKVALITGANRGIGLETARQLAEKDVVVLLGVRDRTKGETAAKNIRQAQVIELDVTNPDHHKAAHDHITRKFGKLDILINNAGIAPEVKLPTEIRFRPSVLPIEVAREVIETNFIAALALTQTLLPLIHKSSEGRIVNVASRLGSLSGNASAPTQGWYDELAYNASKASLLMFTILLARELKETPIKVNAAHPGATQTEMLGSYKGSLTPVEGAKTSVWLATLPEDGPTGGFFHQQESLPW